MAADQGVTAGGVETAGGGPSTGPGARRSDLAPEALHDRLAAMLQLEAARAAAPVVPAAPTRRPRADARDNRLRLLAAADAVFGREGVGASLDLIAREAEVGRATLYRHFPSRESLLLALHDGLLSNLEVHARELGERGTALFELLAFYVDHVSPRATLVDHWLTYAPDAPLVVAARTRLLALIEPLLARAVRAGHCRPEISAIDLLIVLNMLTPRPTGRSGEERRLLARRALDLITVGLRP